MKVLYTGLARSIWGFDLNVFNPKGLSLQPIIETLNERYQFGKSPKNQLDVDDRKSLSFKGGLFKDSKGTPVSITFTIFNDGFVADTTASTDVSTEFLTEVRSWIESDYGLKLPTRVRKAFVSQLDVECEWSLLQLSPILGKLGEFIDSHVKTLDERERHFDFSGLSFWTEDVDKTSAPATFKFERKISAPFSTKHYFSQAPLETQHHREALDMLETFLYR
jgi:hypothetical protein